MSALRRSILLLCLFAVSCSIEMLPEGSGTGDGIEIQIVWQWDIERTYNRDDLCWLGIDPATGKEMNWRSLQDGNLGHRPVGYGGEPLSPEWWVRYRIGLP